MDDALHLAAAQGGIITKKQLLRLGYGPRQVAAMKLGGHIRTVARGAFTTTAALEPHAEADDVDPAEMAARKAERDLHEHVLRAKAGLLLYPDSRLCSVSALVAHEIDTYIAGNGPADLGRVHLMRPVKHEVLTSDFVVHPAVGPSIGSPIGPTAPLPHAVADVAMRHGLLPGLVSANCALQRGAITALDVHVEVESRDQWPNVTVARKMLTYLDPLAESVGETLMGFGLRVAGLHVDSQVRVLDGNVVVARCDFRVRGTPVLLEFDGAVKYRFHGSKALMDEKRREDRLRRLGWVVVRVTWADLQRMDVVLGWIRAAIITGGPLTASHRVAA